MATTYPPAHLLGLPLELREAIYEHLTADTETLHLWDRKCALHLSAARTFPPSLLQAHPVLHQEALAHFYRTGSVTLHVDAYAFACLRNTNAYTIALQHCHYLQRTRSLDLRPTLNASIEFLRDAMQLTVPVLLSPPFAVKKVAITWAEAKVHVTHRAWRPWAYKGIALEPLWGLLGRVEIKCNGAINPPPATAELEDQGLRRFVDAITKYDEL